VRSDTTFDDCLETGGTGGSVGASTGYGRVDIYMPSGNPFTRLRTKMVVPKPPKTNDVLFLWPGLEPGSGGKNYNPIGFGVMQPVLTWGPSCAPNHLGDKYDSWWISAQYVNIPGGYPGHTGCLGGDSMKVAVGDILNIDMNLAGTVWTQTVTCESTGKSVDFSIDMLGQDQNMALFIIEDTYVSPSEELVFTSSILTFTSAAPSACAITWHGTNDYVATPRPLRNGLECCIPRMVLRAKGVAATASN
jgi:hypothetical protein